MPKEVLKFVSESQKLAGLSSHISEATASYAPDMDKIRKAAKKFGAQVPAFRGKLNSHQLHFGRPLKTHRSGGAP